MKASLILFILGGILLSSVLGSEESSEEDALGADGELFLKFMVQLGWSLKKQDILTSAIKLLREKAGVAVHLVATQDVTDQNTGEIKEITALELRFPKLNNVSYAEENDQFDVNYQIPFIENHKDLLKGLETYLHNPHIIYQRNYSGSEMDYFYQSSDIIYFSNSNEGYINTTHVVSKAELNTELDKIKTSLKDNPVPPSILKYNVDNTMIIEESVLEGNNLILVDEVEGATFEQVQNFIEASVEYLLCNSKKEVPRELCIELEVTYREYRWHCFFEAANNAYYLENSITVTLRLKAITEYSDNLKIIGMKR